MNLFLGPWLWYIGFKKVKSNEHQAKPWTWYVGGIICISTLIIVPSTVLSMNTHKKSGVRAMESREKDHMRQEAFYVGFALAQYHLLTGNITEDFDFDNVDVPNREFEYEISSVSGDTLIEMKAISPNYDDMFLKVDIRPYGTPVMKQWNE